MFPKLLLEKSLNEQLSLRIGRDMGIARAEKCPPALVREAGIGKRHEGMRAPSYLLGKPRLRVRKGKTNVVVEAERDQRDGPGHACRIDI